MGSDLDWEILRLTKDLNVLTTWRPDEGIDIVKNVEVISEFQGQRQALVPYQLFQNC